MTNHLASFDFNSSRQEDNIFKQVSLINNNQATSISNNNNFDNHYNHHNPHLKHQQQLRDHYRTDTDTSATKIIMEAGFWDSITDERVNEFYLLRGGPSIILTVVIIYLYFVLSLGPKLMAKHEAFKLNKLLLFYNVGMAAANLWLFIQGLLVSNYGLDTLGCGKFGGDIRQSPRRGIYLGYLFFLTKLIELLDTVFFVLRKKHGQITFLHVFHHSVVPLFCWIGIKLAPGGPNGFFPLVNSFIHVVMYSYYALTTFGPRVQPYLWWKRYLTTLQMIQFVLVMLNAFKTFMSQDCKFPILFAYLQATVAIAFFILFAFFYHDAYHKNKASSAKRNGRVRYAASSSAIKDHNDYTSQCTTTTTTTILNGKPKTVLSQLNFNNNNSNSNNNNNEDHDNQTVPSVTRRLNGLNGKVHQNVKLI